MGISLKKPGALIVLAGACFQPTQAFAFRTAADAPEFPDEQRVVWQDVRVGFSLHPTGLPVGVRAGDIATALERALEAWAEPTCTSARPFVASNVLGAPAPRDRVNSIAWVQAWASTGLPPNAAAYTDVQYQRTGGIWSIVEADVYLNAEGFLWGVADDSERNARAVLTHEIGHALGLLHPCEPMAQDGAPMCSAIGDSERSASMYPLYDTEQSFLAPDDIAGICYLYPSADDPCAVCQAGEVCIDRACRARCVGTICDPGMACGFWGCALPHSCLAESCDGRACSDDVSCAPLARCVNGTCRGGDAGWGEDCVNSADCSNGACVDGVCQPLCQAGTVCGRSGDCTAAVDRGLSGCIQSGSYSFGAPCHEGSDCETGVCAFGEQGGICSRACSQQQPCDLGLSCTRVEGRDVCVRRDLRPSGGCALDASTSQPTFSAGLVLLFGILAQLRRKRPRRSEW